MSSYIDAQGIWHHTKECTRCHAVKPLTEFDKWKVAPVGVHPQCKVCKRGHERLRRYGITPDEYDAMLTAQNGVCGICAQPPRPYERKGLLCVDHDHETGRVRGLLCGKCNSAIGLLDDSDERAKTAWDYLRSGGCVVVV